MTLDAAPWPWSPTLCPADEDFIEWLMEHKREKWLAGTVFHLGPGAHHRVPRSCSALGLECVSYTVSDEEHFMAPTLDGYRCELKNIWDIDYDSLPEFQFMTLFHFGEEAWKWGEVDIAKLRELVSHVPKGGYVFFYGRSAAFDRQLDFILEATAIGLLKSKYQHRSVLVYEKLR